MQTTSHLMMIRPASFQFNEETAVSNDYQQKNNALTATEIINKAKEEFDEFVDILQDNDIDITVIEDTIAPPKPDAVFPNNWISMHADGTIYLFPMKTENRRIEKRMDIIEILKKKFTVKEIVDLSHYEQQNLALEGTGSMIFDHDNKLVYACLSPRTDIEVLNDFTKRIGYSPIVFHS